MALRIVFCGTPAFAVPALQQLIAHPNFQVIAVVTQPDRPRGRNQELAESPVKQAAAASGISVYQPQKIKADESCEFFKSLAPDVVVIIAYGQIISQRLIDIPRLGWINVHGSLLPKYRGAAPINWAIVNGEARTGLTTMLIDAGLDTGPMLLKYETAIGPAETAPEVISRLAEAGGPLMIETLEKLERGEIAPEPQDNSQATFAPPLKKEDGRIEWSLEAKKIYNRIRGLQPWPGAFTSFSGRRCQIWSTLLLDESIMGNLKSGSGSNAWVDGAIITLGPEIFVTCGQGTALRLEFVQMEGRKRVTAREFASGLRLAVGDRFGN